MIGSELEMAIRPLRAAEATQATTAGVTDGAPATEAASKERPSDLSKAAEEFESLLINMMVKAMRDSVPRSDLFGKSSHMETYEGLRDQELAKSMAQGGGLGFARLILQQFEGREDEGLEELGQMHQQMNAAASSYETYGTTPGVLSVPPGDE